MNLRSEEITDVIKPEAIPKLKVGQLLVFNYEGKRIDLKITRKTKDRIWAKKITTYSQDQIKVVDNVNKDTKIK